MHDDLTRQLRDGIDAELGSRPARDLSDVVTRGRRKRSGLRLMTAAAIVLVGTALFAGGLAISHSVAGDEPLPPANSNVIDTVTPTPANSNETDTVTPTQAKDAMLTNPGGTGRYFVDPDGDDATPLRVTFQGTEGWTSWFGAFKYLKGEADGFTGLSITTVSNLVGDGCRDHTALDPPVGPTVDDLATALSRLEPFEVAAPPTDVTLFGYQGKYLELKVPALKVTGGGDASQSVNVAKFTDCVEGELHSWISPINDLSSTLLGHSSGIKEPGVFNAYQVPGQTEEFWILDVEGTRVVFVSFDTPGAPDADVVERNAMFDSIRIEP